MKMNTMKEISNGGRSSPGRLPKGNKIIVILVIC
jgi:hypothetical protein